MDHLHNNPPKPFNLDYRPGFSGAVSLKYADWCENNPNATQNDRKCIYRIISERLKQDFPSIREQLT